MRKYDIPEDVLTQYGVLERTQGPAHARMSPSSASRWLLCPGSVTLCDEVKERHTNEYAAEGTVAHHIRETCLAYDLEPEDFIGHEISADGYTFVVDEAMTVALEPGIDWVRERKGRVVNEHRVSFDRWLPGQFGTLDVGIIEKDLIIINDLKFGAGMPVSAYQNVQLMIYALGFWDQIARYETDATEFLIVVDQPRARGTSGSRVKASDWDDEENTEEEAAQEWGGEWHISLGDLLAFGEKLKTGYDLAISRDAWLRAGEIQCQHCSRTGSCDEFARWSTALLQLEFADLDPDVIILPNHGEFTPLHRVNVQKNQAMIKKWLLAVHNQVLFDAKMGKETPGLKAVAGNRGPRKWADEAEAEEFMRDELPDVTELFHAPKMLSPAQFEKKKISPEAKAEVKDHVTRSEGKPILVGVGDNRPAVLLADEWDDENEEEPSVDDLLG